MTQYPFENELPAPKTFVDAKNRKWFPRVDGLVMRDFDARLDGQGGGIFQLIFDMLGDLSPKDLQKGKEVDINPGRIWAIARRIFGRIENLQFLLYKACREDDRLTGRKPKVTYDDFCEGFTGRALRDAITCAMELMLDYFPDVEETEGKQADPFGGKRGLGAKFTGARR